MKKKRHLISYSGSCLINESGDLAPNPHSLTSVISPSHPRVDSHVGCRRGDRRYPLRVGARNQVVCRATITQGHPERATKVSPRSLPFFPCTFGMNKVQTGALYAVSRLPIPSPRCPFPANLPQDGENSCPHSYPRCWAKTTS